MTVKSLKHRFVSAIADGGDTTLTRPSNWNDDHDFWLGIRAITTTTDTIAHSDHLSLVTYSNAGGVAVGLPAPSGGNFPLGWHARLRNLGVGAVTITGTGGATINAAGSIALAQNDTLDLYSIGTTAYIGVKISPVTAVVAVRSINVQVFTSSGTYTPSANLVFCDIECVGGGGGGGGIGGGQGTVAGDGSGTSYLAAGGGSGGYSRRTVSAATIGASQAVTIGAAGTAGAAGGAGDYGGTGGAGGNTFVGAAYATAICAANGGTGGVGLNAANWSGGLGGNLTGAVGDYTAAGMPGECASSGAYSHGVMPPANGGSSFFGGGGRAGVYAANVSNSIAGSAGSNYGGGGGGATLTDVNTGRAGGAGSKGVVIITEFIS